MESVEQFCTNWYFKTVSLAQNINYIQGQFKVLAIQLPRAPSCCYVLCLGSYKQKGKNVKIKLNKKKKQNIKFLDWSKNFDNLIINSFCYGVVNTITGKWMSGWHRHNDCFVYKTLYMFKVYFLQLMMF